MHTYLISKLLPLIFSPLGIVIILIFLFIFRKKTKFIYSALISLLVFSNGIVSGLLFNLVEYPWKRLGYSTLNYADGIVVLSTGRHLPPGKTNIIEWQDPDRFFAGINIYRANKSKRLIFTGGVNPLGAKLPPEGDIYLNEAISMGIPKESLFTTYPVLIHSKKLKQLGNYLIKKSSPQKRK